MTVVDDASEATMVDLWKLLELESPDWQDMALCAQADPELFFPEKGGSTREAKKACESCPVREDCLRFALDNDERFGIWGGLSERERRRLKKSLARGNGDARINAGSSVSPYRKSAKVALGAPPVRKVLYLQSEEQDVNPAAPAAVTARYPVVVSRGTRETGMYDSKRCPKALEYLKSCPEMTLTIPSDPKDPRDRRIHLEAELLKAFQVKTAAEARRVCRYLVVNVRGAELVETADGMIVMYVEPVSEVSMPMTDVTDDVAVATPTLVEVSAIEGVAVDLGGNAVVVDCETPSASDGSNSEVAHPSPADAAGDPDEIVDDVSVVWADQVDESICDSLPVATELDSVDAEADLESGVTEAAKADRVEDEESGDGRCVLSSEIEGEIEELTPIEPEMPAVTPITSAPSARKAKKLAGRERQKRNSVEVHDGTLTSAERRARGAANFEELASGASTPAAREQYANLADLAASGLPLDALSSVNSVEDLSRCLDYALAAIKLIIDGKPEILTIEVALQIVDFVRLRLDRLGASGKDKVIKAPKPSRNRATIQPPKAAKTA